LNRGKASCRVARQYTGSAGKITNCEIDVGFTTKPKIARHMIARAIAAKVPFSFVAADGVYGTGAIETLLRNAGKGYVLGVAFNHAFRSWGKPQPGAGPASAIAQSLPKKAWHRLSSGEGTKGPCWHDWAYLSWPISKPVNTTTTLPGNGRGVF